MFRCSLAVRWELMITYARSSVASKQERVAVAVDADGCCGLLSCYWQAALSALT